MFHWKNIPYLKVMKGKWSQYLKFLLKNGPKLPRRKSWFFGLQTILSRIVGELVGGGSVSVAVGVSDRWHATHDMWHRTPDTWHLTPTQPRHQLNVFVLMQLSAYVNWFSVSCMPIIFFFEYRNDILIEIIDVALSISNMLIVKYAHIPIGPVLIPTRRSPISNAGFISFTKFYQRNI